MNELVHILHLEDSPEDAELAQAALEAAGMSCQITRVQTGPDFAGELTRGGYDVILADYNLPSYDGKSALKLARELRSDLPFIFVSGALGERAAIDSLTHGATDYVLKHELSRLAPAVRRALEEAESQAARKRAQQALQESERRYRLLAENVRDVIWTMDGNFRFTYISPSVRYLRGIEVEEAMAEVLEETMTPESYQIVRDAIAKVLESESPGVVPIVNRLAIQQKHKDGSLVWVEVVAHLVVDAEGKRVGVMGVSRDISERKEAEENLRLSYAKLNETLREAINALASAIEMRDPYTTGHQERVARLACAIAGEMGLSADTIEGIRIAGTIHDIGKLSVPAEILSRPMVLTKLERSLVETHSQVGYTILSKIQFPWPIAQIVYQHHERENGSGYPLGLLAKDILREAKIVCVADVVEAMSSHRPYRPALGIDKALEEIAQFRGVLYNADVVDACLRLFAGKRFAFE